MPRQVTREKQWTDWVETCTVCGKDFTVGDPTAKGCGEPLTLCRDCRGTKAEADERARQKTRIGGATVVDTRVLRVYDDKAKLQGILIQTLDGTLLEITTEPDYDGGANLVVHKPERGAYPVGDGSNKHP